MRGIAAGVRGTAGNQTGSAEEIRTPGLDRLLWLFLRLLLSKAALQDASRTFLKGLVTIDKSASGTDSFLGEYGMNLSKKARAVAIPASWRRA